MNYKKIDETLSVLDGMRFDLSKEDWAKIKSDLIAKGREEGRKEVMDTCAACSRVQREEGRKEGIDIVMRILKRPVGVHIVKTTGMFYELAGITEASQEEIMKEAIQSARADCPSNSAELEVAAARRDKHENNR